MYVITAWHCVWTRANSRTGWKSPLSTWWQVMQGWRIPAISDVMPISCTQTRSILDIVDIWLLYRVSHCILYYTTQATSIHIQHKTHTNCTVQVKGLMYLPGTRGWFLIHPSSDWPRCSQASSHTVAKAWHAAPLAEWSNRGDQTEYCGEWSVMGCPCRVTGCPRPFAWCFYFGGDASIKRRYSL